MHIKEILTEGPKVPGPLLKSLALQAMGDANIEYDITSWDNNTYYYIDHMRMSSRIKFVGTYVNERELGRLSTIFDIICNVENGMGVRTEVGNTDKGSFRTRNGLYFRIFN